jgi:hypothetical protein
MPLPPKPIVLADLEATSFNEEETQKKNSRSIRCFKKLSPSKMSENQAAGQDIDAQGEKIELDYDQVVL